MKNKIKAGYFTMLAALMISYSMAHFEPQVLEVTDVANEQFLQRPRVMASGNVVIIDDKSVPNEYFGNLFIGSEVWPAKVSYDTMSDWTVVSSDFAVERSHTKQAWQNKEGTAVIRSVSIGGEDLQGPVYNDSMCLIHPGEAGDSGSARLCVKDLPFIWASIDADENTYQGVLGLARGPQGRTNYVKLL